MRQRERILEELKQIEEGLRQAKDDYWAQQVEIQRQAATAWVAFAEGKKDSATKLMRTAADLEDGSEKHVAMENRLWPMRELLGDLLLEANEPGLALKEYEAALQLARYRYRGFSGGCESRATFRRPGKGARILREAPQPVQQR